MTQPVGQVRGLQGRRHQAAFLAAVGWPDPGNLAEI
jgi:hypothetical protein